MPGAGGPPGPGAGPVEPPGRGCGPGGRAANPFRPAAAGLPEPANRVYGGDMNAPDWWSIEVMDTGDGAVHTASGWRDAYAQALAESLVTNGATTWRWSEHGWGVLLEVAFADEAGWQRW